MSKPAQPLLTTVSLAVGANVYTLEELPSTGSPTTTKEGAFVAYLTSSTTPGDGKASPISASD